MLVDTCHSFASTPPRFDAAVGSALPRQAGRRDSSTATRNIGRLATVSAFALVGLRPGRGSAIFPIERAT
jgi:hypothetical protein